MSNGSSLRIKLSHFDFWGKIASMFISNLSIVDRIALKRHQLKLTVFAFVFCIHAVRIYRAMKVRSIICLCYRHKETLWQLAMVGEMVQNSQSLYSFTFNALIDIHEYIYSHSTTEFTFKKYIYSHLPAYFLFTIIFAHIYEMSSFTFNELYPFTFTIEIFIQHFLRITFAHQY